MSPAILPVFGAAFTYDPNLVDTVVWEDGIPEHMTQHAILVTFNTKGLTN